MFDTCLFSSFDYDRLYWESIIATVLSTSFTRKILINVTKTKQLVGTLAKLPIEISHRNLHRTLSEVGRLKQPFGKTTLESPMHWWRNSVPCEFVWWEVRLVMMKLTWKERTSSVFLLFGATRTLVVLYLVDRDFLRWTFAKRGTFSLDDTVRCSFWK